MAVRVGWIDYLNSLPVYHGLDTGAVPLPPGVTLEKATPTALNAKLLAGDLDVSPVSSVHYARHAEDLVLLPDLSINSTGFVHSVCLFFRNGVESLRGGRVCVTGESATSDVLLRILLEKRLGVDARRVKGPQRPGGSSGPPSGGEPDLEEIGHAYEGVLLIGDGAMKASLAYPQLGRLDLGDEWTRWTGTPMVFAVWAARRDFARRDPQGLAAAHRALLAGKAWGRANRAAIVDHARRQLFLSRAYMERYFRDLNYDLDAPKLAGLRRYCELARDLGEIPRVPDLAPLEVPA
ncbi:MAG TPA: menaquinone biosynthesis protein [Candidatus Thermoplasmatota archaeon]|nr:menaquinone biosynthesis protein [Candidatus Thermoplasmatota archaeon]